MHPFQCLSGGTGRTGTFIAVSILLERLKTEGVVDVFHTVRTLRLQRPGMVQTVVSSSFRVIYIFEYTGVGYGYQTIYLHVLSCMTHFKLLFSSLSTVSATKLLSSSFSRLSIIPTSSNRTIITAS